MCVQPLESGNLWVSGSTDTSVRIWNLAQRAELSMVACSNPVTHIVVSGNRVFAAAGETVAAIDVGATAAVVSEFAATLDQSSVSVPDDQI
jgi:WD40 repeat protein